MPREELNAEQRRAAEAADGPLLIIAGPGTGKTKTLAHRIAYLVQNRGVRPDQILALTFTKKAAEEMRQRVGSLTGTSAPGNRSRAETYVSGSASAEFPKTEIPAREPSISTFHALCHELLGGNLNFVTEPDRLKVIKSLTRPAALRHLSAREAGLHISRAKNSPDLQDAFTQAYNLALVQQGLSDFDDLLLKAHELLTNDSAAKKQTQERYRYILVDEFQDTNRLQYELLRLLMGNQNIFVIGDPKQSIYGFRGAGGDIFGRFKNDFPEAQEITLHVNYRSRPEIVGLSNAVFAEGTPLDAHHKLKGQVRAVQTLNEYAEAAWVVTEIQKAIGGGDFLHAVSDDERAQHRRLSDFAVLYRSRAVAVALQKAIADSGLPFQVVGDGSPYDRPDMQAIIALLKALASGEDVAVKGFTKSQCRVLLAGIDAAAAPSEIVDEVVRAFGFEAGQEVAQLSNLLVRFDNLPAALEYLDDISEGQFYDPQADAVTLLTIHAAKGLEFQHMFLIGCEEDVLPHTKADVEEERRLFYVAVTRARERLDIIHAKFRAGKPATPSRFTAELAEAILPKTVDQNLENDERRAKKRKAKRSQQRLF